MAITSSAKKAHRASLKKRVFNMRRKRALLTATKNVRNLLVSGKAAEAGTSLSAAYQAIDKAAKRGVISKNAASRKKARLAKAIKKAEGK